MNMKRYFTPLLILLLLTAAALTQPPKKGPWPGKATAAVCLTYDDALNGHLDHAIPQLEEYGFRGTFYCTGNSGCLNKRMDEWRAAAARGHELGNHSLFHPCDGEKAGDWITKDYDLRYYSMERMINELRTANTLLKAIDGQNSRTYGYTCSHSETGGESFVDELRELFTAARSDGPIPSSLQEVDIHHAPSWCVDSPSLEELIAYAEEASAKGTMAIIMFHGVGDSYLNVDPEVHRAFLAYLAANRESYYVDTFMESMQHLSAWQSEHPPE